MSQEISFTAGQKRENCTKSVNFLLPKLYSYTNRIAEEDNQMDFRSKMAAEHEHKASTCSRENCNMV